MSRGALTFLFLALSAAACGRCGQPDRAARPRAAATVNGEPVPVEAVRRELALDRVAGATLPPEVERSVLDGAIDRVLLLQEARARSIAVSTEQVERALLQLRAEYPGTHFDDLLAQQRLSAAELKSRLADRLVVERLLAQEVFPRVKVSDEEVRAWYDQHPEAFDEPERVRARQIVVRTRAEAQRLREELRRRPQGFADVARRASIAPEGLNGGDLGYFGKGSGMPEVFDVCFRLPLLALSEVTASPYGFHLFQVTERKPAARRPFEEAAPGIRRDLIRAGRARVQEEYLQALRRKARIEIDPGALGAQNP